jgi:hypothetical protein
MFTVQSHITETLLPVLAKMLFTGPALFQLEDEDAIELGLRSEVVGTWNLSKRISYHW